MKKFTIKAAKDSSWTTFDVTSNGKVLDNIDAPSFSAAARDVAGWAWDDHSKKGNILTVKNRKTGETKTFEVVRKGTVKEINASTSIKAAVKNGYYEVIRYDDDGTPVEIKSVEDGVRYRIVKRGNEYVVKAMWTGQSDYSKETFDTPQDASDAMLKFRCTFRDLDAYDFESDRFIFKESTSTKRKAVKAGYTPKKNVLWLFDADAQQWVPWGTWSKDTVTEEEMYELNHRRFPNPEYDADYNYTEYMLLPNDGSEPDDGRKVRASTSTKRKFSVKASATAKRKAAVKAASEVAFHLYGYDKDGADVDTRFTRSASGIEDAVDELFGYDEVDTVDIYSGGMSGEGDYVGTITRSEYDNDASARVRELLDMNGIKSAKSIKCASDTDFRKMFTRPMAKPPANIQYINVTFTDGRSATYTSEILDDLRNDPDVDSIIDAETGELLYDKAHDFIEMAESITCSDNSDLTVDLSDLELGEPYYENRDDDPENPDKWVLVIGKNPAEQKNYKLWYYVEDPDTDITTIDLSTPDHIDLDEMSTMDDYDEIQLAEDIKCNSTVLRDKDITGTDDVEELVLYITNDFGIYKSRIVPVVENLKRKVKSGKFDESKAPDAFKYAVEDGVRKYDKEFVSGRGDVKLLSTATRREIAKELYEHYKEWIFEDVKASTETDDLVIL